MCRAILARSKPGPADVLALEMQPEDGLAVPDVKKVDHDAPPEPPQNALVNVERPVGRHHHDGLVGRLGVDAVYLG